MARRHKDRVAGGLADKSSPSDFDQDQLRMGIDVEMEHTKSRSVAREIAMDHLKEDPRYYTKLKKIHKESLDMNLTETIGWLFNLRESLEEAESVKATGQTRGYLPGVSRPSSKPPPVKAAARRMAGKKPLPTRGGTQRPNVAMKKPGGDDTADALSHLKKMNRSDTDKALADVRTLNKGGKLESFHVSMIRRLIEADREGGGSPLNSRERSAKGMDKVNMLRRTAPSLAKGSKKPMRPKVKRPMPTRGSY